MLLSLVLAVVACAITLIIVTIVTPTFLKDCDSDCRVQSDLYACMVLGLLLVALVAWHRSKIWATPSLLNAPAVVKRKLNTSALDGLRGFATGYVGVCMCAPPSHACGAHDSMSCLRADHYIRFYDSFDLLAPCLMNFFYLLSGFVMTLGYGDRSFETRDFLVKRCARIAPMYYLTNGAMVFAHIYFYHTDAALFAKGGYLGLTFTTTFTFSHYAPWNDVAWTIQVFLFCYLCYPCIAPRLRRLAPTSVRPVAAISYVIYLVLSLLVFAGLPARAGWKGAGQPGLAFGASYNVAWVQLPVFVMGCCAGECSALWCTNP